MQKRRDGHEEHCGGGWAHLATNCVLMRTWLDICREGRGFGWMLAYMLYLPYKLFPQGGE